MRFAANAKREWRRLSKEWHAFGEIGTFINARTERLPPSVRKDYRSRLQPYLFSLDQVLVWLHLVSELTLKVAKQHGPKKGPGFARLHG